MSFLESEKFEKAVGFIFNHEGGFQNNPNDPGNYANGKLIGTNMGISAKAFPQFDIQNLSRDTAKSIYKQEFWDRIKGESLPEPVALVAMNIAVMSGTGRAAQFLQEEFPELKKDRAIGPKTLQAIRERDPIELAHSLLDKHLAYMKSLPQWQSFGRGWSRRVEELREMINERAISF